MQGSTTMIAPKPANAVCQELKLKIETALKRLANVHTEKFPSKKAFITALIVSLEIESEKKKAGISTKGKRYRKFFPIYFVV
jgi:hypothetical protein